ncbi:SMP-30/gluconolactonase/LRE family protein [Microbaculum marinisediminis]|uniref:SMP-30/gluconolactonase/LRE family protein n=1 Tax=Microbaculum marinisediminis TaxID=2931392 RepID=A0AAW5QY88_9HYPH|nr:SMP-30/gluconolactonase/LRE family protein [Microbaculum sp. A6E488]MCT8971386.1 SMP-30/gluconolactonase/LRE family protein [Microbaculum sp. A6E488]
MTQDRSDAWPVLRTQAQLGEGPVWCGRRNRLFWTDILGQSFSQFDPTTGQNTTITLDDPLCAFALMADGRFLCAFAHCIAIMDATGGREPALYRLTGEDPANRFNDGKCDARGRFWIGTMNTQGKRGLGALYRFDPDGTLHRMWDGLSTSNGLGWSPDGHVFYLTDSPTGQIHAFDFDPDQGRISRQRCFARIPADIGRPDGLCVDTRGYVWSAIWDGARVLRFAPDGTIDREIHLPVPRPTSVAFGGPGLTRLYVTSCRGGLDAATLERHPLSGSLFALDPGVQGRPEPLAAF